MPKPVPVGILVLHGLTDNRLWDLIVNVIAPISMRSVETLLLARPARGIVTRLMREIGPMSDVALEFPLAAAALAPLRAKSEMAGSADFTSLWSGQAARLNRELPAAELTKQLAAETVEKLRRLQNVASADVHDLLAKAAALAGSFSAD